MRADSIYIRFYIHQQTTVLGPNCWLIPREHMLVCKEKKTDVENFDFQPQEVVWKLGVDSIIMEFHKDLLSEYKLRSREGGKSENQWFSLKITNFRKLIHNDYLSAANILGLVEKQRTSTFT